MHSSVTCKLSLETYYIQAVLTSFVFFFDTKEEINPFPISKTLPATVFTLSSNFDFYSNSPFV
jgi:hypothetical protein